MSSPLSRHNGLRAVQSANAKVSLGPLSKWAQGQPQWDQEWWRMFLEPRYLACLKGFVFVSYGSDHQTLEYLLHTWRHPLGCSSRTHAQASSLTYSVFLQNATVSLVSTERCQKKEDRWLVKQFLVSPEIRSSTTESAHRNWVWGTSLESQHLELKALATFGYFKDSYMTPCHQKRGLGARRNPQR